MQARHQSARQKLGAYLCLLAAVLFYAPLGAFAYDAISMSCCEGDHCPLHHHHQQKQQTHETDCGHESDEMAACSMSCCHTPEKLTLAALAFVLPRPGIAAEELIVTGALETPRSNEIRSSHEPTLPPPRLSAAAL